MLHNEKHKEWEQRIAEFQQSGLNMRRWCREQQIPYERMKYWKNRLKENAALTSGDSTKVALPIWVQVPAVLEKKVLLSSPVTGNLLIHIHEIVVEVPAGFDAVTLREVLSAVQTPW